MNIDLPTISAINSISPTAARILRWAMATEAVERVELIEEALDGIAVKLSENRHLYHDQTEDQITAAIIINLGMAGIDAEHDAQIGGHCDIIVRAKPDFLWIAEAKISYSNSYLEEGFKQLSTRYSTGLPGQDRGELLIYHKRPDLVGMLRSWVEHMQSAQPDVSFELEEAGKIHRRSVHTHESSGLPFKIRHKPILLHFQPQDKSGRSAKRGRRE